jgi:hypothetical protein
VTRERDGQVAAAMERIETILNAVEAGGDFAPLARLLACRTDLSVDKVMGALRAAQSDARKGMPVDSGRDWAAFWPIVPAMSERPPASLQRAGRAHCNLMGPPWVVAQPGVTPDPTRRLAPGFCRRSTTT